MGATVQLVGVTKTYGSVRALLGVSLALEAGRVAVVEGPNGSGKSTLLAVIGTLARPTSGRVDHGAFGRTRQEIRRSLGWLGHESLCYADLTGRENIELAARMRGLSAEEAYRSAADRFELGAFADRIMRTYSRGQRQRVALARALVHAPGLLLLDEPTTGLDVGSIARLLQVVREEATRGATVVVVTHDRDFGRDVGNDLYRLERGRLTA